MRKVAGVPDMLVRDLPDAVIIEIDAQAARLGVSRAEYVRRQLVSESQRVKRAVTVSDLERSDGALAGLLDDELMERAWR